MYSFLQDVINEVSGNDNAIKMSYPDRLPEKINTLLSYFETEEETKLKPLKHFFEAILLNLSIKNPTLKIL